MNKILRIIICLSFFLLFASCKNDKPYSEVILPVYPKAEKIRYEYSELPEGKMIHYQVNIEFPANDLIEFFDKEISKLGYQKSSYNPESDRKWTMFSQEKLEFVEVKNKPAVFISFWADKNKKNQIGFTLNYPEPDKNTVYVLFGIGSYFSTKKVDEFFEKVDQKGETLAFSNLLKKYEEKNKMANLKKALKENPNNELLKEYVDILTGKIK